MVLYFVCSIILMFCVFVFVDFAVTHHTFSVCLLPFIISFLAKSYYQWVGSSLGTTFSRGSPDVIIN